MKFYIKVNLLRTPTIWLTRNKRKFYNVSFYAKFHASNNVFYCWFGKKAETLTHAMSVEGSKRKRERERACVCRARNRNTACFWKWRRRRRRRRRCHNVLAGVVCDCMFVCVYKFSVFLSDKMKRNWKAQAHRGKWVLVATNHSTDQHACCCVMSFCGFLFRKYSNFLDARTLVKYFEWKTGS